MWRKIARIPFFCRSRLSKIVVSGQATSSPNMSSLCVLSCFVFHQGSCILMNWLPGKSIRKKWWPNDNENRLLHWGERRGHGLSGDGPGIFPICPLSWPIHSTYKEQSWKGLATQSGPCPEKSGNPRVWKPLGLSIMCKWTRPLWGTDCRRAPKSLSSAQAAPVCSAGIKRAWKCLQG